MCEAYNISYVVFCRRIKSGWTLERALTEPEGHILPATDHLGRTYLSTRKMCATYRISADLFRYRIRKGMSLKDALTIPAKNMEYEGFSVDAFAFQDNDGTLYYECRCKKCGYNNILTYEEMAEHHLEHK